jgi:hypothetical protein
MNQTTRTGYRGATASVLLVGGGAIAAGTWVSGDHGFAVGLVGFYVIVAAVAYVWSGGRGDVAAIMRAGGDERQRTIDRDATAIMGLAMGLAAVIGVIVQAARHGDAGAFAVLCFVGGVSYILGLAVLRRRR